MSSKNPSRFALFDSKHLYLLYPDQGNASTGFKYHGNLENLILPGPSCSKDG